MSSAARSLTPPEVLLAHCLRLRHLVTTGCNKVTSGVCRLVGAARAVWEVTGVYTWQFGGEAPHSRAKTWPCCPCPAL